LTLPLFNQAPLLETERLLLTAHRPEDFTALAALWADPQVVRFIGGRPSDAEQSWSRLIRYAGLWPLLGLGYWAVRDKTSQAYLGEMGFAHFHRAITPRIDEYPEMGWLLATEAQGKGYAQEALSAIIQWGHQHLAGKTAVCMIDPDHRASLALAAKLGFVPLRDDSYHGSPVKLLQLPLKS